MINSNDILIRPTMVCYYEAIELIDSEAGHNAEAKYAQMIILMANFNELDRGAKSLVFGVQSQRFK